MTFGPASDDLVALHDVVARYCTRRVEPVNDASLAADLLLKRSLINRLELDFARDAARFDASYSEEELVNPSAVSWLREHAHMTSHAAATAVCAGTGAARLQLSAAALVDGRIGFAHFGWMASTARALADRARRRRSSTSAGCSTRPRPSPCSASARSATTSATPPTGPPSSRSRSPATSSAASP